MKAFQCSDSCREGYWTDEVVQILCNNEFDDHHFAAFVDEKVLLLIQQIKNVILSC